jgi:hypothetical protein
MLEALAILGSLWPGALFARSTPGIDVVWIAILPFFATTVPAAGALFPMGAVRESLDALPPLVALALLLPAALGLLLLAPFALGLFELWFGERSALPA